MNRFSFAFILALALSFPLIEGCKNGATSPNGNNSNGWTESTSSAPWAARYGLSGAVLNGNMWIVGGASGSGVTTYYGDVWKSSDGKNWTNTANPGFGGRYGSQVVSFNNQLFLIGGNASGTIKNDVWSSPDGTTWTQILANNSAITKATVGGTQFCPRQDFTALVFNNLIYVLNGADSATTSDGLNDVWSSPDGVTWTQVLANNINGTATQYQPRWGSAAVSFNNNLYVVSGHYTGPNNSIYIGSDIWSSANGSTWSPVTGSFAQVYYHQVVVNNGAMWFTCGYDPALGGAITAVYDSTSWLSWNTDKAPFDERFGHLSLSFNNDVWIMGGCDNNNGSLVYYNDVWHTS